MDWLHSRLQCEYENYGMAPYSPPNCRIANKKAMTIIRNKNTVIEDALKKLNLKIVTKDIEKNGNSLFEAVKISYQKCADYITAEPYQDVIQKIIFDKIDNPLALFLRIMIKLDPEELHETRERFISRNSNLPRHEMSRIWYDELYQSSEDSIIVQILSQTLCNDIIVVDRDLSSIQAFNQAFNHKPVIIVRNEGFYFSLTTNR